MWGVEYQIKCSRVLLAMEMHHLNVGCSIPEFNPLPVAVEADLFNVGAGSAHTTKIPETRQDKESPVFHQAVRLKCS